MLTRYDNEATTRGAKKRRDEMFWRLRKSGILVRRWTDRSRTRERYMIDVIRERVEFTTKEG